MNEEAHGQPASRPAIPPMATPPVAFAAPALSYAPSQPTGPPGPVPEQERYATLDTLRGVAIVGILMVNIAYYAFPVLEAERAPWSEESALGGALARIVETFFTLKFITLFSLLFGMGLALQLRRADRAGRPFAGMYARRLAFLLVFGLAHGVLLFHGDILTTYALVGFVALALCRASARTLIVIAMGLFLLPFLLYSGCAAADPNANWEAKTWAGQFGQDALNDHTRGFIDFMDREEEVYRAGSFGEIVLHRLALFAMSMLAVGLGGFIWRSLALFLVGILLCRAGWFDDSPRHRRRYRWMIAIGAPLGLGVQMTGLLAERVTDYPAWQGFVEIAALMLGSPGLTVAYMGVIGLACTDPTWVARLRPVQAVGRMALSNYLGHSMICAFLFHSYGLGLFGALAYWQVILIAIAIFGLQLIVSPIWLSRFRFGPFEWLWRSLTYWTPQPFVRRRVPVPGAPTG